MKFASLEGGGFVLFHKKERAQGLVEYALLIVLIALVCVILIAVFGTQVAGLYSQIVANWPIS
jgi:pilus assembly protein Flp/PilA